MSTTLRLLVVSSALGVLFAVGCVGCESDLQHASEDCPDRECTPCSDDSDCEDGTYCGTDDGHQVCLLQQCEPGEQRCAGDDIERCSDDGSQWLEPQSCPGDECDDGQCVCENDDDCAPGAECEFQSCVCPSEVRCGQNQECCGDGEVCREVESCDNGDDCETVETCQPECTGNVCGFEGELCCEGDEPVCGPHGECAPDCGEDRPLCGDDFDECCSAGDLCLYGNCVTPGEDCQEFTDCGFDEYCEPVIGQCVPDQFPDDIECSEEGQFEEMEITEKWAWTEDDTTATPVVGDVTGDGETNVVTITMREGDVVILDNQGQEMERIEHDPSNDKWGGHWRSNPALGDVTGDGRLEIIYVSHHGTGCCSGDSYIVATDGDGETVWRSHDEDGDYVDFRYNTGAIGVANLNGDPSTAEVMAGAAIIDSEGRVVSNEGGDANEYGSSGSYYGGVTIAADLLGDGQHELVTGRNAWTIDWDDSGDDWPDVELTELWENTDGADGYPAVADISGNGEPEVVIFAGGELRVLEGDTGKLWCGVDPTGQACEDDDSLRTQPILSPEGSLSRGGAPTVADYSGDGRPEVGVAGDSLYTVFDFYRPSFGDDDEPEQIDADLLDEFDQDDPEVGDIFVRWYQQTQDSSEATGSSVFDFQGNGRASVVYNDECYLRVYDGYDGDVQLRTQNSTGTRIEYPIVVDVDENRRSEIVVGANDQSRNCDAWDPDDSYEERSGIYVYEDPNELWVHTRSIWNQHAYSIENINDDGSLPSLIDDWWLTHNTFRANRQGEVPLNAPDVVVSSIQTDPQTCLGGLDFEVTVENQGLRAIPAGLPVQLYNATSGEELQTKILDEPIAPGSLVTLTFSHDIPDADLNNAVTYQVVANDDGDDDAEISTDCNPETAESEQLEVTCYYTG